jgi:hypothetical protein
LTVLLLFAQCKMHYWWLVTWLDMTCSAQISCREEVGVSFFCTRHFRTANSTPLISISLNLAPFGELGWKVITLKGLFQSSASAHLWAPEEVENWNAMRTDEVIRYCGHVRGAISNHKRNSSKLLSCCMCRDLKETSEREVTTSARMGRLKVKMIISTHFQSTR